MLGFDSTEYDSDGDGLNNFIEVYVTGTEPTMVDSDEDGISDADEDADGDGLTNIEEIGLGTELAKADSDNDGLTDSEDPDRLCNTFSGSMIGYYDVAEASYTFDYRNFFRSADTYSNTLCSASLIFSNTIYDAAGYRYASGMEIQDISDQLRYHGFDNVIDYKLAEGFNNEEFYAGTYWDDDISEVAIGYHEVTYNGLTKTILAVVIRGTDGSIEEWSSNFDMGDPETWHEEYHKGFYTTEERIKSFVAQYVDAYLSDAEGLTYWITGHSRGAALSNILAARLIDEGNTVYAYTFATPSTTVSENRGDAAYNSIFNFANTGDFVTYVPLQEWNFGRFGVTYFMNIEDENLESEWMRQTGASKYNSLSQSIITLSTNRIVTSCCASWDEVHDRVGAQNISDTKYNCISDRAMAYCDVTERFTALGKHKGYVLNPSAAFVF